MTDDLIRMAAGAPVAALLGAASLTDGGAEVYGDEAIVAAFRARPLDLAAATIVTAERTVIAFAGPQALVADVGDGFIMRLWRVGGAPQPRERRIDVPFDPDLRQRRGSVVFDPAAFGLDIAAGERLAAAAAGLVAASAAARTRAFVIRAVAAGTTAAALVALYRADPGSIGFGYAVIAAADGATTVIADDPPTDAWQPRL